MSKRRASFETRLAGYPISLVQTGFDRFTVQYGQQRMDNLDYCRAAAKLGESIMHAIACEGKLDNRTKTEAREQGDTRPVFDLIGND